jgi:SAM-dependent methyltransferase
VSPSAAENGELWGARAGDWAEQEALHRPLYDEAIRRAGVGPGTRVLDVGCGSGVFLRAASDHGAEVSGLDASEELAAIARTRVPGAEVRVGDLQLLPHDDASFDVVTGFNSFQFARDPIEALREARRVVRHGGKVVIQVWGRPERCDLAVLPRALSALRPSTPGGASAPAGLAAPGVLEGLASDAGLTPVDAFDVVTRFEYRDEATMLRLVLSSAAGVDAIRASGEPAANEAARAALAPFSTPAGGYVLENEWHVLIAAA